MSLWFRQSTTLCQPRRTMKKNGRNPKLRMRWRAMENPLKQFSDQYKSGKRPETIKQITKLQAKRRKWERDHRIADWIILILTAGFAAWIYINDPTFKNWVS
jgi:hypothetical protein